MHAMLANLMTAIFALAAAMLSIGASGAMAEADHAAIARASLTEVIRPGYDAFAETTNALSTKVDALCKEPSETALKGARDAFATAVAAWSRVEIFRFGPIVEGHRFDRLFYWPDPKSLGLKQIQDVLARKDESTTNPDTLAGKSVALQGLPALEYLLYGDGADALAKGDGAPAFRCRFAASVAANVAKLAAVVEEEWADGAPFAKVFLEPTPSDPVYHASKEVTLDLFKSFATGIELVRDQKLGKPLGASPAEAKPKLAAFWRSGVAFPNMVGNLEGVRLLFFKGGFAQVVADDSPGVEDSILFDLDHGIEVLSGIDQPIAEAMADDSTHAKLEALRVGLKSAAQTASDIIARSAGLSLGFNAMDGD
jgi:uncharacterized protein